jgi:hypothetical protein
MKLLVVIPCCREDVARAEKTLDLIYQLEGRTAKGSCLLVFAPEVHAESKDKLRIAAELAFKSVDILDLKQLITVGKDKGAAVYAMFHAIAQHIPTAYRWPWLWLEPDCLPLKPGWREKLAEGYDNQCHRYLSRWLAAGEQRFIARVGVYPVNILGDIEIANVSQVPFPTSVLDKSTKCDLFQEMTVTSVDMVNKIRPDAVLLHSDKEGVLMDWVRSSLQTNGHHSPVVEVEEATVIPLTPPKPRGRPPKVKPVIV